VNRILQIAISLISLCGYSQYGIDRYEVDSLQFYSKDIVTYDFYLDKPLQGFYFDSIYYLDRPNIIVRIINNTSDTVLNRYKERSSRIHWLRKDARYNDPLAPGEQLILLGKWPDIQPKGSFNSPINLSYVQGDSLYHNRINVWGSVFPQKESISQRPIKVNWKEYNMSFATNSQRPHGIERFKGNVHDYNQEKSHYEFKIAHNNLHHSVGPIGVNDIFSWGILTPQHYEKEYLFNFKNDSDYPLYILDISAYSKNFNVKHVGKNILLPDSITSISFKPTFNSSGHFYGKVSIYYLRNGKYGYYDMGIWGYQPQPNLSKIRQKNKPDSIAIILIDKNKNSVDNLSLKIFKNDSIYYPKFRKVKGEFLINIPKKHPNSFFYELRDTNNMALSKGYIKDDFKIKNKFIWVNELRKETHTYSGLSGPVRYKVLEGIYFIKWDKSYKQEEVIEYLKLKGIKTSSTSEVYLTLKNKIKAIEIQKEVYKSKYKIVLLPTINYSRVNKSGWGGGYEYYDNVFSIQFFPNVKKEKIEAIFKQHSITEFSSLGTNELGLLKYTFTINNIVDLKYISKLDKLYDLSEVYSLDQQTNGLPGLD
jgi:hypothetical protein